MLISRLPTRLRELAELRRKEKPYTEKEEDSLDWAFLWDQTKEGHCFWYNIDSGNIPDEYKENNEIFYY